MSDFNTNLAIFEENSPEALLVSQDEFWDLHVKCFTHIWNGFEKAQWQLVIIAGSLTRTYGNGAVKEFHSALQASGTSVDISYIYDFIQMYNKLVKTNSTQVENLSFTAHKIIAKESDTPEQVEHFIATAVQNPQWSCNNLANHIRNEKSKIITDGQLPTLKYHGELRGEVLKLYHLAVEEFETENPTHVFEHLLRVYFGGQFLTIQLPLSDEQHAEVLEAIEAIKGHWTTLEAYLLKEILREGREIKRNGN